MGRFNVKRIEVDTNQGGFIKNILFCESKTKFMLRKLPFIGVKK